MTTRLYLHQETNTTPGVPSGVSPFATNANGALGMLSNDSGLNVFFAGQYNPNSKVPRQLSQFPQNSQSVLTNLMHLQTAPITNHNGFQASAVEVVDFIGRWVSNPIRGRVYDRAGIYNVLWGSSFFLPYASNSGRIGVMNMQFGFYFWRPSTQTVVPMNFIQGGGFTDHTQKNQVGFTPISSSTDYPVINNVEFSFLDTVASGFGQVDETGYVLQDGDVFVTEVSMWLGGTNNNLSTNLMGSFFYGGSNPVPSATDTLTTPTIVNRVRDIASYVELPFDLQFLSQEPVQPMPPVRGMYGLVSTL